MPRFYGQDCADELCVLLEGIKTDEVRLMVMAGASAAFDGKDPAERHR